MSTVTSEWTNLLRVLGEVKHIYISAAAIDNHFVKVSKSEVFKTIMLYLEMEEEQGYNTPTIPKFVIDEANVLWIG